uniref:helix-turn-helix transcriptional regulator n=1 Tax=Gelidibacter sp. TaxID=2018083 RepID=UPI00404B6611
MSRKKLNRLKTVLSEQERSNKWLANKINRSETTVSNWCTNARQPSIETLIQISIALKVEVGTLLITDI